MSKHLKYMTIGKKGGMAEEVLILGGNEYTTYFIRTKELDEVDRKRMRMILDKRDADRLDLWDIMDQVTLGNGKNALEYFHQLAYAMDNEGNLGKPGRVFGIKRRPTQRPAAKAVAQAEAEPESDVDLQSVAQQVVQKKGPGRPKTK
jgi:hypothetical protein